MMYAAAASDLFNFLGTGFLEVRKFLIKKNINIRLSISNGQNFRAINYS